MKYEICFSDLREESQKELMEAVGINDPSEMNWDVDFPLAILEIND